jgi:death-on-curing protein
LTDWVWVPAHLVVRWQARLVERFGGAPGLGDQGLLEAALMRPRNYLEYADVDGIPVEALAARYGVALAGSHAFIDGNKRIAFAVMVAFLKAHGRPPDATEQAATAMMIDVAAGNVDEAALTSWLTAHSPP